MRMGRYTWIFAFLVLLPSVSYADTYSWGVSKTATVRYPSVPALCDAEWSGATGTYYKNQGYEQAGYRMTTATQASCDMVQPPSTALATYTNAYRTGTECPVDTAYNSSTGACDAASTPAGQACVGTGDALTGFGFITNSSGECVDYTRADMPAQCKNLGGTTGFKTVYVSFDGDGNPQAPPPITTGGCQAIPGDVAHCTMAPKRVFPTGGSIQPTSNKCRIAVSFTGDTADNGSAGPMPTDGPDDDGVCVGDCPDLPPAPTENDTQPCTYVEDGEGRKVCSSSNYNYSPGNSSCGSVNGEFQCVGKAPTTNGIKIDTTVTDTTNSDGTTTSVKKDTATKVSCTGANSCTSQTTTNTTTTTYNSNGAKTGQSTSCTGPACSSDGKGDSDGDGLEDCAVGNCSEEEPVEIGAQGWHASGDETFATAFEGFTTRVTAAPVMKAGDKFFEFNPSGACPAWSVNTWVFSITIDQHCSPDIPWDVIKAIIMACAGFVAFRWALL